MADLHRYHGVRLAEVREHYTATEVADWVTYLPCDAAIRQSVDPAWRHTDELEMLRGIHFRLMRLEWQNGGGQGEQPGPVRFAWEPYPDKADRPNSMTTEQLADWIGDERLAEALGIEV